MRPRCLPDLSHQRRWNNWFRVSLRSRPALINQRGPGALCQPPSYINRHLESVHQPLSCHVLTNDLFAIKAISWRFDRILPLKRQQHQPQLTILTKPTCSWQKVNWSHIPDLPEATTSRCHGAQTGLKVLLKTYFGPQVSIEIVHRYV